MKKNLAEVGGYSSQCYETLQCSHILSGPTSSISPSEKAHQDSLALAQQIASACSEAKAENIKVLALKGVSDLADYFIIVSGRSDRHVQGISNKVLDALTHTGFEPYSVDGIEHAHWVVIDCAKVIVHVFYEPTRQHYDLEGLWHRAAAVDTSQWT